MKHGTIGAAIALTMCCGTASAQEAGSRLNLVCVGAGSANHVTNSYSYGVDNQGNSATVNTLGKQAVAFGDQVSLWIEGSEGRVRMPRTMLPVVRGGDDGWFKINSLKVSKDEITGSVGVNVVNNPKFRLDRVTGSISIAGKAGDYNGTCSKYDPATVERAF